MVKLRLAGAVKVPVLVNVSWVTIPTLELEEELFEEFVELEEFTEEDC